MTKSAPPDFINNDYAGFWPRAIALLLDSIFLTLANLPIIFIALLVVGSFTGTQDSKDAHTWIAMGQTYLVCSILYLLYYSIFECTKQATPGKMLLGLEVTDVDGRKLHFGRALGRNIGKYVSGFFFIGYIMAAVTARKQALHDIMAGCLVVRKHQSKETSWSASHHKHKTSWTDPSGRNPGSDVKGAPLPATPSKVSSTSTADSAGQHNTATLSNNQPAATPVIAHQPSVSEPIATPVITHQAAAEPATPPVIVYQPVASEPAVFSEPTTLSIPPQGELVPAPMDSGSPSQATDKLCQNCGAVIDKNFSFCLKCMAPTS